MHEYGTSKPIKVILKRGREKRENNGGNEPNWGTLWIAYMEIVTTKPYTTSHINTNVSKIQ
jgi:hypothetical protein